MNTNFNLLITMDKNGGVEIDHQPFYKCMIDSSFFNAFIQNEIVISTYDIYTNFNKDRLNSCFNYVIHENDDTCISKDNISFLDDIESVLRSISNQRNLNINLSDQDVYIIGGSRLYNEFLSNHRDLINNVIVTELNDEYDASGFIDKTHIDNNFYKNNKIKIKSISHNIGAIYLYK